MGEPVLVFEMAPRDGLQNEKKLIATADKVGLVDRLSACGFRKIEVTSFVAPKWVPQMADAAEVLGTITRRKGAFYTALTPNVKGLEGALAARADEVAVFAAASETFSHKNINCSIAESLLRFQPVIERARANSLPVRGYVSCVTDCPYEGPIAPETVARVARSLLDLGCYQISLGDTIGYATPETTRAMLDTVLTEIRGEELAGHFHDTRGRALENIDVALECGLRVFDSSVGGLGGCPYAPGAKGNVATEAVVEMLEARGFSTGIDRAALAEAATFARQLRCAQ
ncbi:hydroxymethylglutaryl-CoA lyase [Neorhizobium sp. LjRoot104]|uniref:hydroxymethylglutaryl-CoA lyase n=1 Tax=Neorhizobium sp. LjRoot104 TaxID=3342254 RepID=UPI003ECDD593